MLNRDLLQEENKELMQKLMQAVQADDEEAAVKAFGEFGEAIEKRICQEYEQLKGTNDTNILAQRGIRQLTNEEKEFYQAWINAHKSGNPKQAITDSGKAMPETIIDEVLEDIQESHELLNTVNFINAQGAIKMIVNADNLDLATWDALTSKIATELTGKIDVADLTMAKLSAFIPVPKDMIDLGPTWIDNYVRIILSEAISGGLEKAIIKGTGKNQPIGMCKDLSGSVVEGVYSDKTKVTLKTLDPVEYCKVIAPLAVKPTSDDEKKEYRVVPEVAFICNPVDYIGKVMPSSTIRAADGTYKNNVFPYPTKPIQSAALSENEAILGIANKYFMAVGAGKSGKIEYSDEYQFLEDNRVYLTKLYGMGKPKDNNAFIYLDITNMKPAPVEVKVTNATVSSTEE